MTILGYLWSKFSKEQIISLRSRRITRYFEFGLSAKVCVKYSAHTRDFENTTGLSVILSNHPRSPCLKKPRYASLSTSLSIAMNSDTCVEISLHAEMRYGVGQVPVVKILGFSFRMFINTEEQVLGSPRQ